MIKVNYNPIINIPWRKKKKKQQHKYNQIGVKTNITQQIKDTSHFGELIGWFRPYDMATERNRTNLRKKTSFHPEDRKKEKFAFLGTYGVILDVK